MNCQTNGLLGGRAISVKLLILPTELGAKLFPHGKAELETQRLRRNEALVHGHFWSRRTRSISPCADDHTSVSHVPPQIHYDAMTIAIR